MLQCKCQVFPCLMLGEPRGWQGCCWEYMLSSHILSWTNIIQVPQGPITQLKLENWKVSEGI